MTIDQKHIRQIQQASRLAMIDGGYRVSERWFMPALHCHA